MPHCDQALTIRSARAIVLFGMGRSFEHLIQQAAPKSGIWDSAKIVGVCQQAAPMCLPESFTQAASRPRHTTTA